MRTVGLVVLLLGILQGPALAQRWGAPQDRVPGVLHYQALNLAADDSTLSRIDVLYRVETDFFVPIRNTDRSFSWPFRREGEILIELVDSTGESKARKIRNVELGASTSEPNPEQKEWMEGIASFSVPPGRYSIVVEVTDQESRRQFLDRSRSITGRKISPSTLSSPLICTVHPMGAIGDTLKPLNFGGDALFEQPATLFIETGYRGAADSASFQWTISTFDEPGADSSLALSGTLNGLPVLRGVRLTDGEQSEYALLRESGRPISGVLVPLPFEKLPLRNCRLSATLTIGTSRQTVVMPFRILWPDMPMAMKDVDYALDALRIVVSADKLDSLKTGNLNKRRNNLEAYWTAKAASAGQSYRVLTSQFYRRVDYAVKQFATLRQPDGSKTDRGKVFILYGPPTTTERHLDPSAPFQEVWLYEKTGKRFVFVDQTRTGNYALESPSQP